MYNIYIYICIEYHDHVDYYLSWEKRGRMVAPAWPPMMGMEMSLGWHHLSNATGLIQPHMFYAFSVKSRTIILCHMICHFCRNHALDT